MHENGFEMFSFCFKYIENFETWNHLFHEFHSFMLLKMLILAIRQAKPRCDPAKQNDEKADNNKSRINLFVLNSSPRLWLRDSHTQTLQRLKEIGGMVESSSQVADGKQAAEDTLQHQHQLKWLHERDIIIATQIILIN